MQFTWLLAIVFALIALAAGQNCPKNFQLDEQKLCTTNRPIHGECPTDSIYNINKNKCVYAARG